MMLDNDPKNKLEIIKFNPNDKEDTRSAFIYIQQKYLEACKKFYKKLIEDNFLNKK